MMKINESKKIDIADKSIEMLRTTISYLSKKHKIAFETRRDKNGNVWINRTS